MATQKPRKEEIDTVMAVARTCRGPYLVADDEQKKGFAAWKDIEQTGDEKAARTMIARLEEAATELAPPGFAVAAPIVEEGDWPGLRRAANPLIRLRGDRVGKGCGWNLNEEILKHPFDGAEHMTICPDCGIEISWKAPVFYD